VKLTVLGCSGTWPNDGTATSGYLVQHDGFNLYLDAGTGTLANLQRHISGSPRSTPSAITHEHPTTSSTCTRRSTRCSTAGSGSPGSRSFVPLEFRQKLADVVSIDSQVGMHTAFAFQRGPSG